MKFFYKPSFLFSKKPLHNRIDQAAQELYEKLENFNFATLGISDYTRNYLFQDHISNLERCLQKYSFILATVVEKTGLPLEKITFMDYGGGVGILALLARQAGAQTVLYNDIYDVSCKDAQIIACALDLEADHYICGDIDQVVSYCRAHEIACNGIGSYDVLEHIYDVPMFMKTIEKVPTSGPLCVMMASGANGANPRIRNALQKLHHDHEYEDRLNEWGHKKRDCLQSFFSVRKQIIQEYDSTLSNKEVTAITAITRGKIKADIHATVDRYKKTGSLPAVPSYTDTCDPYTGNWSEHLLDPYEVCSYVDQTKFKTNVVCGYYGHNTDWKRKTVGMLLNGLNACMPTKLALKSAPFYAIVLEITGSNRSKLL